MIDEPMGIINFNIPHRLKTWLKNYAARNDVAMKVVVIDALEEYWAKHDPPEMRPRGRKR